MIWIIKDADGNVLNRIVAEEAYVKANYEHYEEDTTPDYPVYTEEQMMRHWRDSELQRTDVLLLLPEHPDKDSLTDYRQALRDWPSTSDFPDTQPTMGS